jgi:hypothetical protein
MKNKRSGPKASAGKRSEAATRNNHKLMINQYTRLTNSVSLNDTAIDSLPRTAVYCGAGGLRVHTTLPSPKPHAILAGRDDHAHAGTASASIAAGATAFVAGRPSAATSAGTGRRQSGHSGRSISHLPMHSSWNPCPHPGSTRTGTADGSQSPEHPAAPASSERHTAHSCAATAHAAPSCRSPCDHAKARIPAVAAAAAAAAAAAPATTAPAIAIMES